MKTIRAKVLHSVDDELQQLDAMLAGLSIIGSSLIEHGSKEVGIAVHGLALHGQNLHDEIKKILAATSSSRCASSAVSASRGS